MHGDWLESKEVQLGANSGYQVAIAKAIANMQTKE